MLQNTDIRLSEASLKQFTYTIFCQIGCSDADASLATNTLLSADLRGIDSHGIARLSGYARLWEAGRINAKPSIKILYETPSTATIDGDSGLGLVVAPKAMEIAIAKAQVAGTGWVAVGNSNHFGIAGYHAMMALPNDMIGIAMTNASALVAPTHSISRMLGTNPIAVAIPGGKYPPIVIDMATTAASNGKLEILQRKAQDAPIGWVQTASGSDAKDANILKKGGAMLPLGSSPTLSSHKGYALGSWVDIFCGVLSGANYGPWVPPFPAYVPMPDNMPGKGIGHFLGAMRIDAFAPKEYFYEHIERWIDAFRNAQPINTEQPVIIPGDPERLAETDRKLNGIPVNASVVNDLKQLGDKFGIPFPI